MRTAATRRGRLPRPRPAFVVAALAVVLALAGGYLWLRDSSLAEVRTVHISGVSAAGGAPIRRALESAARDMTTLHVREDALRSAVKPYPIVKSVSARADWPHTLFVEVVEYRPVALVESAGRRTPVTVDGRALDGALAGGALPVVKTDALRGDRVRGRAALAQLAILGGAPLGLRSAIERIWHAADGVHVQLANGPELLFGGGARAGAKWAAVTGVLADPSAKGARYVDARLPERAVAGPFPQDGSPADPTAGDGATADGTGTDGASAGTSAADGAGTDASSVPDGTDGATP